MTEYPPKSETGDGHYQEDRGHGMTATAREYAQQAVHAAKDFTGYLRSHSTKQMKADVERNVRAHPLTAVAIGLGIGLLLGRLMK